MDKQPFTCIDVEKAAREANIEPGLGLGETQEALKKLNILPVGYIQDCDGRGNVFFKPIYKR